MQLTKLDGSVQSSPHPNRVHSHIRLNDLCKWPSLGRLCHIPLQHLFCVTAGLQTRIHGTTSTPSQRTNNQYSGLVARNSCCSLNIAADLIDHLRLIHVVSSTISERVNAGKRRAVGVLELPGPSLECECGTGKTSVITKGSDTAAVVILFVSVSAHPENKLRKKTYSQKLQIIQHPTTSAPSPQRLLPAALVLIAMRKRDMAMSQRKVLGLVQLLQSNDNMVGRNIDPAALWHQRGACGFEFPVCEDALAQGGGRGTLDVDGVAGGDEGAGCGRGEGGSGDTG